MYSFITFYPFTAAFSLYEHVLACTSPDDCEDDILDLEDVGEALSVASARRTNLVPFAKTINALNRVSRTLQDERRRQNSTREHGIPNIGPVEGMNVPSTYGAFQNLMATELPDFDSSTFNFIPDLSTNLDGDFYPQSFVRALENDFIGRHWHSNWWDLNGGMDAEMNVVSER